MTKTHLQNAFSFLPSSQINTQTFKLRLFIRNHGVTCFAGCPLNPHFEAVLLCSVNDQMRVSIITPACHAMNSSRGKSGLCRRALACNMRKGKQPAVILSMLYCTCESLLSSFKCLVIVDSDFLWGEGCFR